MMCVSLSAFTILINLSPFFTVILQHFIFKEHLAWYDLIFMCCSFGGVALVALADPTDDRTPTSEMFSAWDKNTRYIFGISLSLLMAVFFSIWMMSVRMLRDIHYSVIFLHGMVFDAAMVLLALITWYIYNSMQDTVENWPFNFTSNWAFAEFAASGTANAIA